ncbi:MAG: competence/damage-inducible protein A [Bacteroidia bacterium]|nr:competence/damage-inducible protein A [Bacteroidia bacterium]
MQAEIITIGDELLIGQVIDTNSAWLGQTLNRAGIRIKRINSVSDDASEIVNQLEDCLKRSELIIITGGLGPTKDDITKKTLASYFKMGWREDADVLKQLEELFAKRGRVMIEANRQQAMLPDGCKTLINNWGTAPGMWFEIDGKIIISMPGVPYEMKNIFEHVAMPLITSRFKQPTLYHKTLVTINIPESLLALKIEGIEDSLPKHIKLAYLPNWNIVRLRLTGSQQDNLDIKSEIDSYAKQITDLIPENIVSEEDLSMEEVVSNLLRSKKQTLSLAESCTGGYLAHLMTRLPGSSKIFTGSVVSYAYEAKTIELGVPEELLLTKGAVSEEVVTIMSEAIRKKLGTDYSIAISGIAGPDGGTTEKPVGTVWISVSSADKTITELRHFPGDRINIIGRTANIALDNLRRLILES